MKGHDLAKIKKYESKNSIDVHNLVERWPRLWQAPLTRRLPTKVRTCVISHGR
jgi:hypothetical protein